MFALFAWVVCEYAWEGWRVCKARRAVRQVQHATAGDVPLPLTAHVDEVVARPTVTSLSVQ